MTIDIRTFDPTINPLLRPDQDTDSYKYSHFLQVPTGTVRMVSYIEPRGFDVERRIVSPEIRRELAKLGAEHMKVIIDNATRDAPRWTHVTMYGLQILLRRWFSQRVTIQDVKKTAAWCAAHGLPFPEEGWMRIATVHNGYVPIRISALPEGSIVPLRVPLIRVENMDLEIPWITAFVETQLSRFWYPCTVATQSMEIKTDVYKALVDTCDDPDTEIGFKLHDFGARGVSSQESAGIGGSAHITQFMGTDTTAGIHYAQAYYDEPTMPAFSIPASEHSTMTSWGGPDHEIDAIANMFEKFAGNGPLMAIVSDSYDIFRCVKEYYGKVLKDKVEALAEIGTTLVVRPDSGDPTTVPVEVIKMLGDAFGYTINSKGYKVLPKFIRVIQGDGVNQRSIRMILNNLTKRDLTNGQPGWSAENIAFGMGGALLQQVDRDTLQFAMKTCWILRNGVSVDVYKQPITDSKKNSKKGDQAVIQTNVIDFTAVRRDELGNDQKDALIPIWDTGKELVTYTFADIRKRASEGWRTLYEQRYGTVKKKAA